MALFQTVINGIKPFRNRLLLMTISRRTIRTIHYNSPGQPFPSTTHKADRFTSISNKFMLCTLEIILFLYLFSVFCLFLVKNTFGLRFHFRLDRLLGQNIPLSLSLCALVTRLEISIAITASVYSLLLTKPNKVKINSLLNCNILGTILY